MGSPAALTALVTAYYNSEWLLTEDIDWLHQVAPRGFNVMHGAAFRGLECFAFLTLNMMGDLGWDHRLDPPDEGIRFVKQVARELERGHDQFCRAVKWLCSAKDARPDKSGDALGRPSSGRLDLGRYPLIDKESEEHIHYLETHGLRHLKIHAWLGSGDRPRSGRLRVTPRYTHTVDLFAAFLLAECSNKLPAQMPIKLCQHCGRLFSAMEVQGKARTSKQYCSAKCQRAAWWPNDKRADDAFVKRLEILKPADLRNRLKKLSVRDRLDGIEKRWSEVWPNLAERVKKLREWAEKFGEEGEQ